MFGLLSPKAQSATYRHAYSQVCRSHHIQHGKISLVFHSYEAVILYLLAADAGCFICGNTEKCCRLRRRPQNEPCETSLRAAGFAANFSLLLAWVKLKDDREDANSLVSRIGLLALRRPFGRMWTYFEQLEPGFHKNVEDLLQAHHRIEQSRTSDTNQFSQTTGESFAYLFGLFARTVGIEDRLSPFKAIGDRLGRAIIYIDIAADYYMDKKNGHFNPLRSASDIVGAFETGRRYMREAESLCSQSFAGNVAPAVLRSIHDSFSCSAEGVVTKSREKCGKGGTLIDTVNLGCQETELSGKSDWTVGKLYCDPCCFVAGAGASRSGCCDDCGNDCCGGSRSSSGEDCCE